MLEPSSKSKSTRGPCQLTLEQGDDKRIQCWEKRRLAIDGEVVYFECVSCNSHGNPMSHATVRVKSSSRFHEYCSPGASLEQRQSQFFGSA
uniref:Uncharacterized protein n=1 Tax=Romanomermis culicivorax TaxID=13658 RepID=A0A915IPR9_ROMCU